MKITFPTFYIKNILIQISALIVLVFLFLCTESAFARASIHLCTYTISTNDTENTPAPHASLYDNLARYLQRDFIVTGKRDPIETELVSYHQNYSELTKYDLRKFGISVPYVLIASGIVNSKFTTEDFSSRIPIFIPGAGVITPSIDITDTVPEYHYRVQIDYAVYKTSTGKRLLSWSDSDRVQDDRKNCTECIQDVIDDITEDIYQNVNVSNHGFLFVSTNADGAFFLGGSKPKGGGFGFAAKTFFTGAGFDLSYDMFWLNQSNQFVQRLYIGPCMGKKIYRSGKALDMVFPNGSLGFGLIHYRTHAKDINNGYRGMFSGRGGCLLVLKRLPVSIEPCVNISVSTDQLIAIPSLRIGITKDFKMIH